MEFLWDTFVVKSYSLQTLKTKINISVNKRLCVVVIFSYIQIYDKKVQENITSMLVYT